MAEELSLPRMMVMIMMVMIMMMMINIINRMIINIMMIKMTSPLKSPAILNVSAP